MRQNCPKCRKLSRISLHSPRVECMEHFFSSGQHFLPCRQSRQLLCKWWRILRKLQRSCSSSLAFRATPVVFHLLNEMQNIFNAHWNILNKTIHNITWYLPFKYFVEIWWGVLNMFSSLSQISFKWSWNVFSQFSWTWEGAIHSLKHVSNFKL